MNYAILPAPPPGGGFLVLNKTQIGCLDLLCAIKTYYPNTKIIVQQPIPVEKSSELYHRQYD